MIQDHQQQIRTQWSVRWRSLKEIRVYGQELPTNEKKLDDSEFNEVHSLLPEQTLLQ